MLVGNEPARAHRSLAARRCDRLAGGHSRASACGALPC
jgi:hypothetical protein